MDHDVPEETAFPLEELGHVVRRLRYVMPIISSDEAILQYASQQKYILITCNRDDYLTLTGTVEHAGIIILIRRRSRALERAAIVRLVDAAAETGLKNNINFA